MGVADVELEVGHFLVDEMFEGDESGLDVAHREERRSDAGEIELAAFEIDDVEEQAAGVGVVVMGANHVAGDSDGLAIADIDGGGADESGGDVAGDGDGVGESEGQATAAAAAIGVIDLDEKARSVGAVVVADEDFAGVELGDGETIDLLEASAEFAQDAEVRSGEDRDREFGGVCAFFVSDFQHGCGQSEFPAAAEAGGFGDDHRIVVAWIDLDVFG